MAAAAIVMVVFFLLDVVMIIVGIGTHEHGLIPPAGWFVRVVWVLACGFLVELCRNRP